MEMDNLCNIYIPQNVVLLKANNGDYLLVDSNSGGWAQLDPCGGKILEQMKRGTPIHEIEKIHKTAPIILNELTNEGFLTTILPKDEGKETLPQLLSTHIEITNSCNLKCKHCYLSSGVAKPNELTEDEVIEIIDEAAMLGAEKISLSGGEPFLKSWIYDVLRHIIDSGLLAYVFTNGTLLDDRAIDKLKDIKKVVTQISLEGSEPLTHDWIRGNGNYRTVETAIDKLCDAGLADNIILFLTLNSKNIEQLNEFVEFAKGKGIRRIRCTQINKQGRAESEWQAIKTSSKQWIQYGKMVEDLHDKFPNMEIIGNVYGGLKFWEGEFPRMSCDCGKEPRIDCQGNVFPCQMFIYQEYILGNIRHSDLSEVVNNGKLLELRRNILKRTGNFNVCCRCEYYHLCKGGCPGHALSEYGSFNSADSFCEVRKFWFNEFLSRYIMDS